MESSLTPFCSTAQTNIRAHKKCLEIIPTLPQVLINKGLLTQLNGYWLPHFSVLEGTLLAQQHYKASPSDILLATFPKSGTVWLKALTFSIVNRNKYPFHDHPLHKANPHACVPFLETDLYTKNQIPNMDTLNPSPRILSTHAPYPLLSESIAQSGCRVVYLCRNPRDTIVSFHHFSKSLQHQAGVNLGIEVDEALEFFCKGVFPYGPFWDHVLEYWKESSKRPHQVLFLMYEDMKADPFKHLLLLAEFLGYPFSDEEQSEGVVDEIIKLCSFENLKDLKVNKTGKMKVSEITINHASFFRRGEVGDWVNYFNSEMVEKMDQVMEEKLKGSGLVFKYGI